MSNVTDRARWHSKFIGYLVQHLEGTLSVLDDEDCEVLQQLMDNPPAELSPDEIVPHVFVELAALLSKADEDDWALARAMVEERSRTPPQGRPAA